MYYFITLMRRNRLSKLTNSCQKLILSLLHDLKRVSTGIDDLKEVILMWKTKNVQINRKSLKMPNNRHNWMKIQANHRHRLQNATSTEHGSLGDVQRTPICPLNILRTLP